MTYQPPNSVEATVREILKVYVRHRLDDAHNRNDIARSIAKALGPTRRVIVSEREIDTTVIAHLRTLQLGGRATLATKRHLRVACGNLNDSRITAALDRLVHAGAIRTALVDRREKNGQIRPREIYELANSDHG